MVLGVVSGLWCNSEAGVSVDAQRSDCWVARFLYLYFFLRFREIYSYPLLEAHKRWRRIVLHRYVVGRVDLILGSSSHQGSGRQLCFPSWCLSGNRFSPLPRRTMVV